MFQNYGLSALPAATLFALVTTITPGPNNMMLLSSGINFGFRSTLPHVLGISLGVSLMMIAVGLGLGQVFDHYPVLYPILEACSVAYLLYLAWKIGTSGQIETRKGTPRPMRLHEAMAFQLINPKAWMMALTAATTLHLNPNVGINAVWMAIVFCVVGLPCICLWAVCGRAMRSALARPRWLKAFNVLMALSLVATLYPIAEQLIA
jgi:threonine/homoserine/homoserine lactone efflux protein